jgi:hypothetical protein
MDPATVTFIVFVMFAGQNEEVILQSTPVPSVEACGKEVIMLDEQARTFLAKISKEHKSVKLDLTCRISMPVGAPV